MWQFDELLITQCDMATKNHYYNLNYNIYYVK